MPTNFIYRIGGSNTPFSQAEQDNNILAIHDRLSGYGWSLSAIAGACGCFHEESAFNPGIYETSHGGNLNNLPYFPGGMGLAQWTDYPAYTGAYPNPLPWAADKDGRDWWDGDFQCYLLTQCTNPEYTDMGYGQGARWGWQTSNQYPSQSFNTYIHSNQSIADAVKYWFYCLEWHYWGIPDWVNYPARVAWGQYAYQLMSGHTPDPPAPGPGPSPTPTPGIKPKMPLWMYLKRLPF